MSKPMMVRDGSVLLGYTSDNAFTFSDTEQRTLGRAFRILEKHFRTTAVTLNDTLKAIDFLRLMIGHKPHEEFVAIWMDNQLRYINAEVLFRGSVGECRIYEREVVKSALQHNAAAVIFAHNHPSGVAVPSPADLYMDTKLRGLMQHIDVTVVDNFVVGANEVRSLLHPKCSFSFARHVTATVNDQTTPRRKTRQKKGNV